MAEATVPPAALHVPAAKDVPFLSPLASSVLHTTSMTAFGVRLSAVLTAVCGRVPGWEGVPEQYFTIMPLSGGMSNLMYVVECKDDNSPTSPTRGLRVRRAVARILSPQLDAAIDRMREMKIVAYLSNTGIGPRLFGTAKMMPERRESLGPDGVVSAPKALMLRVEEFVDGRTLGVRDLRSSRDICIRMAMKVAQLHSQRPDLCSALARSFSTDSATAPSPLAAGVSSPEPALEEQLQNYLRLMNNIRARAELLAGEAYSMAALPHALRTLLDMAPWGMEAKWLTELMRAAGGPVVLAHGDLQEGNWIQNRDSNQLVLIDYEYAGYNYAGFDLGNLFCEHVADYAVPDAPGFKLEPEHYPACQWQKLFLRVYADTIAAPGITREALESAVESEPWEIFGGAPRESDAQRTSCATDALVSAVGPELASLALSARIGILASHLYWTLWSIVMAAGKCGISSDMLTNDEAAAFADLRASAPPPAPPGTPASRRASIGTAAASVASGHSVFNYAAYGVARAQEYLRLRTQYEKAVEAETASDAN